jgi:hypothetical protein
MAIGTFAHPATMRYDVFIRYPERRSGNGLNFHEMHEIRVFLHKKNVQQEGRASAVDGPAFTVSSNISNIAILPLVSPMSVLAQSMVQSVP